MVKNADVIIPVYAPGEEFLNLISALKEQTIPPNKIIIMNTETNKKNYNPEEICVLYDNIEIYNVKEKEFDHGRTRDQGVQKSTAPFFLCMTQDALPKDKYLIERLLEGMEDETTAVCYGRQLAAGNAHILEEYTRRFNYPEISSVKSWEDIPRLGIKTFFCSNVCALYRRSVYDEVGGFIKKTIFNEDMIYAARAMEAGYCIRYEAEAAVIHSHHYTAMQQFRRNFDLGISQADHPEVFKEISSEKEGGKLVKGTIKYLTEKKKGYLIPYFFYQSFWKYVGYRLGKAYKKIPLFLVKQWSMNKNYW